MDKTSLTGLLALATSALGAMFDPYYANMSWEAPRTLSNWSNLTVSTPTGTFIGALNDTYPNVRQFLRVPYAQVSRRRFPQRIKEKLQEQLTRHTKSHPSVTSVGYLLGIREGRARRSTQRSSVPVRSPGRHV